MNKATRSHNIDTVFVLVIFSVFAFSVLMVLMLGAGVYKNVSDITRQLEGERMALSYVRTKVRNLDSAEGIHVGQLHGATTLQFSENIDGTDYKTVIYSYDGWLYEIFNEASVDFSLADGIRIAQAPDLRFEKQDNGSITVISGDLSLLLTPRSGNGITIAAQS